jgi:hypothetical protein
MMRVFCVMMVSDGVCHHGGKRNKKRGKRVAGRPLADHGRHGKKLIWAGRNKVKADATDVRHGTDSESPSDVFYHLSILYNQRRTHRLFVSNVCHVYHRYTLKLWVTEYTASTGSVRYLLFSLPK